jgi:Cu/Ag efflux pump CusA
MAISTGEGAEVQRPLATVVIGQPISHRIDAMLSGTQASIAIKLFGDDLNRMFAIGNQIKEAVSDVEGIADLNVEQQIERPELKIVPKREMLAKYGISLPQFSEFVTVNMAGEVVSQVYEQGKTFNLVVRAAESDRGTMERVKELMIDDAQGRKIPLSYVADVTSSMGPNTINRENVKRKIVISANTSGRDLRSVVNDIQHRVEEKISLPEGYHIEYGGQFESEQAASRTLLLTSLMSIAVIFLLLYMQFHDAAESGVILLNLPLALIGGVFALFLTTGEVSIPAIIGFISLFGIATRNGMLLVTHYNLLREEQQLGVRESVVRGSLDRLNPYAMTEPAVPFLYPTFETCKLKIVEPTTDIPSQTLFTIFGAPAVITAGEFTYLNLHLLDTIDMDVELAFAISTTKGIGKEFDVTHISNMGLILIHL